MSEEVRALVLTHYFEPAFRGGGPIQTIGALVRSRPAGVSTAILCSNADLGEPAPLVDDPDRWIHRDGFDVWYARPSLGGAMRAMVNSRRIEPDILYVNSFFNLQYSLIPQFLHAFGMWGRAGLVVAPRGELSPGALAIKALKKSLFITVYRLLGQQRRVLWHASTVMEAEEIQRVFGPSAQVAIRENETALPGSAQRRDRRPPGRCRLVYASRIVPKKGLLIALEALAGVGDPVRFDVIGAFEDEVYEAACRQMMTRIPSNVRLAVHGALPRTQLLEELRKADGMVLPTEGENFGHVIAEALSESCPVLCSDRTPWTARLAGGAGCVVSPNTPEEWASAIHAFAAAGSVMWEQYSSRAGAAFDEWRTENKGAHIFELASVHFGSN